MAADFGMWATFAIVLGALALYASERAPIAVISLGLIVALTLFFYFAPVPGADGRNLLNAARLLSGFAHPALVTIISLMIVGQGLARTGLLDRSASLLLVVARGHGGGAVIVAMAAVLLISGLLNNTPVVIIAIPLIQSLAQQIGRRSSALMMPLSFVAILGGMTTLIGSSTNLLVVGAAEQFSNTRIGFFDFTIPGLVIAGVGFIYVVLVVPRLLPERSNEVAAQRTRSGVQYLAQLTVTAGSSLDGLAPRGGFFPELKDVTLRVVHRGDEVLLPPFDDDFRLQPGDILAIAGTRRALTGLLGADGGAFGVEIGEQSRRGGGRMLCEAMVRPASRLEGQTVARARYHYAPHANIIGVQRRGRMRRERVSDIRLEAGDVLLIEGRTDDLSTLRNDPDSLLMEWTTTELPAVHHARTAVAIFTGVVVLAASGALPVVIAALAGAALMLATGVLNRRQALRAIDADVVVLIAAALAMGAALKETGGADFLAAAVVGAVGDAGPATVLSGFFLLVALLANVITAKAAAVLFTPIALSISGRLGLDAEPFVVAVIFAANCGFAAPMGFQTNLLVMTPGHYRFRDFLRAGLPLVFVVWITFSLFAPLYYGL